MQDWSSQASAFGVHPEIPVAACLGIKWESNAYNCFPQEATRRTEPPTRNYKTVLDSTRQTDARGFLNRGSRA